MCWIFPADQVHSTPTGKFQEEATKSARWKAAGRNVYGFASEQTSTPIQQSNAVAAEQVGKGVRL
jgi:hypothetical protein